ncbi:MAG: hypothetical protein ACXW6T_25300 [Candidatus Binatia bacterium]
MSSANTAATRPSARCFSAARVSDQLHDISLAGAGDSALAIEAAYRELTEIRAALLTMMGRKP